MLEPVIFYLIFLLTFCYCRLIVDLDTQIRAKFQLEGDPRSRDRSARNLNQAGEAQISGETHTRGL